MIRFTNRRRSAGRPAIPTATPTSPPVPTAPARETSRPSEADEPSGPTRPSDLLVLRELEIGYAEQRVADAITLTLRAGQALAVIGANGAGKSTLLHTAAGLQPALGGSALLRARPIDEREAAYRAAVATVFDDDAYFAALTVREHLALLAGGHGLVRDAAATAVDRELGFFGLSASADALPLSLSSGQRRRMLLAAAFVRPAELLILDEPEQRLDRGMRARLAERMRQHTDSGAAILFATHDPHFVRTAADAALFVGDPSRHLTPAAGIAAIGEL